MKTIIKLIHAAFAVVVLAITGTTVQGAMGDLFVSIGGIGENGSGSIVRYTPDGVQNLFASGLSQPRGVAFDHSGNQFVANTTCDASYETCVGTIVKITPDGVQSLFATLPGNVYSEGVAFDQAGNLFVAATDNTDLLASAIYKITPGGVPSMFGSLHGWCNGIAFDNRGYLFAADSWFGYVYKFATDGTRSVFADRSDFSPDQYPWGLAFDRFGNLFISTEWNNSMGTDTILKFTPGGVRSTFAAGLDWPRGLAFDRSGNLFVAQRGLFASPGAILKFTPDGFQTVFASGVADPQLLAFQLLPAVPPHPTPPPRPVPPARP